MRPRVGNVTVMEDNLPDIGIFKIQDIIDGPLNVIPLWGSKMNIPSYTHIDDNFKGVVEIDRYLLYITM